MSWYSDGEKPSRWYLELTGDGDSYPEDYDEEREDEDYDD